MNELGTDLFHNHEPLILIDWVLIKQGVLLYYSQGTVKINGLNLLASPTFTSEITSIFPLSL